MDLHLKDKVVVVTGGAAGIGKAIALEFAKEGAVIATFGRRGELVEAFVKELETMGARAYGERVDIRDREKVEDFAQQVVNKFGRIDVWVNNAGVAKAKPFDEYTREEYDYVLDINLRGVLECSAIAAKYMKKQNSGVITNVSSFAAIIPSAGSATYSMTKSAVMSFTRTAAGELAPYNIRVVAVMPGRIRTDIIEELIRTKYDQILADIPLRKIAEPSEVGKLVAFLSSDAASYITGTGVDISGGKFIIQNPQDPWDWKENS